MWVFIVLLAWPLVEIGLFVTVGGAIGVWPTLGIVLATGVIGVMLLRRLGLRAGREVGARLRSFANPLAHVAQDAVAAGGAVLLILPGFLTDALGLLLLLPPVQAMILAILARRLRGARSAGRPAPFGAAPSGLARGPGGGPVIDGEFIEVETPDPARRPSGWTRH